MITTNKWCWRLIDERTLYGLYDNREQALGEAKSYCKDFKELSKPHVIYLGKAVCPEATEYSDKINVLDILQKLSAYAFTDYLNKIKDAGWGELYSRTFLCKPHMDIEANMALNNFLRSWCYLYIESNSNIWNISQNAEIINLENE